MRSVCHCLATTVFICCLSGSAAAYDVATHRELGLRAAQTSPLLDTLLRYELNFPRGADTQFLGSTAPEWIRAGAGLEDEPVTRVVNHFHNPLQSWGRAGLEAFSLRFPSSVLWSQSPAQGELPSDLATGDGTWSWPFARQSYLLALTAAETQAREEAFAKTFRSLGQLTHLVQDATVPAHVRNDRHASLRILGLRMGDPDPYEDWVEDNPSAVGGAPVGPDSSVFRATGDGAAPAPVAGLIDTKTFLGVNSELLAGTSVGNAEYTNGNFLSKDTMFSPDFPFPRLASVDLASPLVEPDGNRFRRYFRKQGEGEPVEHFVAEGLLYKSIVSATGAPLPRAFTLDRRVLRDYAQLLLPRAVGYSAALIDHFFRGDLFASGDNTSVTFRNFGADPMNGTAALYYDDTAGKRHPVVGASWPLDLAPGGSIRDLHFQPPTDPPPQDSARYMLVFTGTLGTESDSVVGRQVGLPSVMTARATIHAGGTPYQGLAVATIDLRNGLGIDETVTASDGRASLRWIPGKTALRVTDAGTVPGSAYWAGGLNFSGKLDGAKRLQPSDLDDQGVVSISIPFLGIEWPEDIEPCTGNTVFRNDTTNDLRVFPIPGGAELASSMYAVHSAVFTYASTGQEVDFSGLGYLVVREAVLVPESMGHVGEVVGHVDRNVESAHNRIQIDHDGNVTAYICSTEYAAEQTLPVSISEYNPRQ